MELKIFTLTIPFHSKSRTISGVLRWTVLL
nr:MAG TPA: hypothetical protein [Caudoviricetes sp.]